MTANPTPCVDSPAVVQSPFSLIIALRLSWPVMIALLASGQDISPGILLMVIFLLGGATLVTALSEGRAGGRRLFAEQSGGGWALRGSWSSLPPCPC
jgi:hypothetical protein